MTVQSGIQMQRAYAGIANKWIPSVTGVDQMPNNYPGSHYFLGSSNQRVGLAIEDQAEYDFGHPTTTSIGFEKMFRAAGVLFLFSLANADAAFANRVTVSLSRPLVTNFTPRQDVTNAAVVLQVEVANSEPVVNLIDKFRRLTGLTLEFTAPLLGVTRRTIQNWKAGEAISSKNEEKLRLLLETTETIQQGSATKTKNLLLGRIPGYLRIYDLLCQGRFADAVARAKLKEPLQPIRSNPNLKFDHLPLAVQLSRGDDGPIIQTGLRVRKLLRRSKA
jgi:hypothetical protein